MNIFSRFSSKIDDLVEKAREIENLKSQISDLEEKIIRAKNENKSLKEIILKS